MATRAEIRDAFLSELESAAATTHTIDDEGGSPVNVTLDADDIGLIEAPSLETLPQIVYEDTYALLEYNGVGAGPDYVERDQNGDVISSQWREYIEAQFIIQIRASTELKKEPIYEAVRTAFAKYRFKPWKKSDLHADVDKIEVLDAVPADAGDVEDPIRGDQLEVRISFHRNYELTNVPNIAQVNHDVDADLSDGTSGFLYTTT